MYRFDLDILIGVVYITYTFISMQLSRVILLLCNWLVFVTCAYDWLITQLSD